MKTLLSLVNKKLHTTFSSLTGTTNTSLMPRLWKKSPPPSFLYSSQLLLLLYSAAITITDTCCIDRTCIKLPKLHSPTPNPACFESGWPVLKRARSCKPGHNIYIKIYIAHAVLKNFPVNYCGRGD